MSVTNVSFVDTNIWLYAFLNKQDAYKREVAQKVVKQKDIIISTQVINELCANLLKKGKLDETQITSLVRSLYKRYGIVDLTQSTFLSASKLRQSYNFSYWDSLIVATALHANATTLYSQDMQAGLVVEGTLKIVNPLIP